MYTTQFTCIHVLGFIRDQVIIMMHSPEDFQKVFDYLRECKKLKTIDNFNLSVHKSGMVEVKLTLLDNVLPFTIIVSSAHDYIWPSADDPDCDLSDWAEEVLGNTAPTQQPSDKPQTKEDVLKKAFDKALDVVG